MADFRHWEIIAKVRSELDQRQPCRVLALSAIRAAIVTVVDVREGRGFELGVFHAATVVSIACGLLRYNSYVSEDIGVTMSWG